ncbi:hypothetical protein RF11_05986 [Thelohanellus kitauei]|uniref:Uncharacterized protein n=1 Tax=Thelohanellus kitauei TaxID=669202 RepID=A0A0C2II36_THEKT|nr:hypothetical protein RF11_05986 [Thelohanellus kitauei]
MTYIWSAPLSGDMHSASSFYVPSLQLTESLENNGMDSFPLVKHTCGNLEPPAEGLRALFLKSPIIYFGRARSVPQLYGVFVVAEHFLFAEVCFSLVVARSRIVYDYIAPP